jgi:hypothetical protein
MMTQAPEQKVTGINTQKRPYSRPSLVEYGSVSKLTQTGAGSGTDGGTAGMSMMCL